MSGAAAAGPQAISFAAYRLLLWQASYDSNLAPAFARLTTQLRALCLAPSSASTVGSTPAAAGNRIALSAILTGARDGSNEQSRYADPAYTPVNQPLVLAQAVSTVHDPTFWQPLALAQVSPRGSSPVPAHVQTFSGSQWGRVRTFASTRPPDPGKPPLGDPAGKAYRDAALGAIRATAGAPAARIDASPLAWERRALSLPRQSLARDLELELALGGALNDAAVAAWRAKRSYQSPRPISMIRYLAFNGQLPLVAGLTRRDGSHTLVRLGGRWVDGAGWTPPAATPPSPGWVSADAAFAYAAARVLGTLTGRSFSQAAAAAANAGAASGTELALDVAAGRKLGNEVGTLALQKIRG
jgi:hypothetical protein